METTDWRPDGVKIIERNGTAASQQERPNPLRRIEWVPLGDEYPGYELKLWRNPPGKRMVAAGELKQRNPTEGTLAILKLHCLDHRCDDGQGGWQPWPHPFEEGVMPTADSDEFWELLPDDIMHFVLIFIGEAEKKAGINARRIFGGSTDSSSGAILPRATDPSGSAGTTS